MALCIFQVEGLMDDIDFKAKVTRAEFEELCADLFERVPRPVQDALASAEMSMVSTPLPFQSGHVQRKQSSGQENQCHLHVAKGEDKGKCTLSKRNVKKKHIKNATCIQTQKHIASQ